MDLGEQSDMNPNRPFRTEGQQQYPSQYPFPQNTSAYTMDQDINMSSDSFAAGVRSHAASQDHTNMAQSSSQPGSSLNTSGNGMTAPGMAPPQNAGHPYSPGGARPSIDETQDGGLSGGDSKRKRSKVSRACDECRRKKVRCDAAAEDGTIKTCSNCARAGLTCDYSRVPMKRGPSKGYIKELSERVQQVESLQMALSSTPGYRPSLDASGTIYAEQPYSPDDAMSIKRNFSFSADQRSPFVGPEYNRDRMPSVGGWNSPHSASIFRARDRGSIAVAPDQQITGAMSFSKPFWTQSLDASPPAKRQKMDSEALTAPELGQEFLSKYYQEFHTCFPILPDADGAITIVGRASTKVQHAFVAAVQRLPDPKLKTQNGTTGGEDVAVTVSHIFKSHQELDEYLWNVTRETPESRPAEDNLVLLWAYLLVAVEAENDLTRLHDGTLPRTILIKHACDLAWSCVTALSKDLTAESDPSNNPPYLNDFARAWHCATVPARLHALAVGSGNPIPRYYHQYFQKHVPDILDVLPSAGAIIALAAAQLTVASCVVQDSLPPSSFGRHCDIHHRLTIQEGFDNFCGNRSMREGNEILVEHLRMFVDLTLSRYTENFHPFDIITAASALAEALRKHLTATQDTFVYNPYHLHFFTLTTITLLEFLSEAHDTDLYKMANAGVDDIKVALEQVSERDHVGDQQQDNIEGAQTESVKKSIHWADALLKMISERVKSVNMNNANGAGVSTGSGSGGNIRLGDGTTASTNFALLLRHGYLTVLAQQVC